MKRILGLLLVGLLLALALEGSAQVYERIIQPGENLYQAVRDIPRGSISDFKVMAGIYTNGVTNLFMNGRWHFNGATLRLIDIPTNTSGAGIFDDRFSGAVTCAITGTLEIQYTPGTNVWVDPADLVNGYNTNALAAIVVTNRKSYILMDASIKAGIYGIAPKPKVLYVDDCATNSSFGRFDNVYFWKPDSAFLSNGVFNVMLRTNHLGVADLYAEIGSSFLRWNEGTMHCRAGNVYVTDYALDCYNSKTNATALFFTADVVSGKAYIVGRTNTWKVWATVKEWQNPNTFNGNAFNFFGAGSHYIQAMKMSAAVSETIRLESPNTAGDSNLVVWVNIDKVSGSNGWVNVLHGSLRGRIGHFEWNGPSASTVVGLNCTNVSAFVSLSGENMPADYTAVVHGGGRMELFNYLIWSTNRSPVFLAADGLKLVSTVLRPSSSASNSIIAQSAQNVRLYGNVIGRVAAHANVTATVGTMVVDADTD